MSTSAGVHFYFNDEFATSLMPTSGGTTCAEIRRHWRHYSQDASPFRFTTDAADGPVLPEEGLLEELYPCRQSLIVYVQRDVQKKGVRIFGTQQEPVVTQLLPQETTQELTERIKVLLDVEEGRVARLLGGNRVLDADSSPHAQLADCPLIELDLQCRFLACCLEPATFHPVLYDEFDRIVVNTDLFYENRCEGADGGDDPLAPPAFPKAAERRKMCLFASEPVRELTGSAEWRATILGNDTKVASDKAVYTLVTKEALLSGATTGIILERRMKIRIRDKLRPRIRTVIVWPTDKIGDLRTSILDSVLLSEELLDSKQSVWEAGLQEGTNLWTTRLIPLRILKDEVEIRVTADLGETLSELHDRIGFPLSKFELWGDGKLLKDKYHCLFEGTKTNSLFDLKIESFCVLTVLPKESLPPHMTFRPLRRNNPTVQLSNP